MGSTIEINDTLQINTDQGFPSDILNIGEYLNNNGRDRESLFEQIKDRVFEFKDKPKVRIYHQPPVRVLLVENVIVNGVEKWIFGVRAWFLQQCMTISIVLHLENLKS